VQAAPPLAAEAAGGAQQTEPEPHPAGGGSTKKEKLRKERQRQHKIEEAKEALDGAMALMEESAGSVKAVEEAMQAAAKHGDRSEPLAALVVVARDLLEQYRAAEAERVRVAAEEAAAAAAVAAAERLELEQELAALTLSVQSDKKRAQSGALRMQQVQAQLGVPPAAPAPGAEETMCVVCFDAPKDHLVLPCKHLCVCGECAEQLTKTRTPMCPVCRGPIRETMKVFCS
jgi:DNA uptake protein ComE-like DNA-binding protein